MRLEEDKAKDRNYRIAARGIRMMHDGWLMARRENPVELLQSLGLRPGDTVMEPGCGPGFYTEGAAKAVGPGGSVYSYDVNPYLIEYVEKKVRKRNLDRVHPICGNAAESGLETGSVDFSFITGIPRAVGGFPALLTEVSRVLKNGGILAYRSHRGDAASAAFDTAGLKLVPEGRINGFEMYRKTAD